MTTREFIKKLENGELRNKMVNVKKPEEAYKIARNEGVTDSSEEFVKTMKEFNNAVNNISEKELNNVLLGASTSEIVSAVSTYTGAAAAAAAAAAI